MNNKTLIVLVVVLVVLLGGLFLLSGFIYDEKQGDFVVGETVNASGKILAVDTTGVAADGPVLITLEDSNKKVHTIAVPSMGLPLCPAYKSNNIGDAFLMKAGDMIEVRGMVGEDGSIVPCESADHFLRPEPLVVENFEGEADPSRMTLTMKTWSWVSASFNDERVVTPKKPNAFTITFEEGGRFSATTDCNSVGGEYSVGANGAITFSEMVQTLMFCEGSQEAEFVQLLSNTAFYHFTSRGDLIFDLKFDSGTVAFK
jgi:heat shock protein HslJ